jgi:AsmA protein
MKKIISIIIVAAAIIALTLIVFIKIYVTPERIKTFLLPYAEETLNRKISVGEIKINLLKGIDVKDFVIKEADKQTDFVKCRDFILKFQVLPLLSKKVVIDEITIISPELKIARDYKGMFNFEDIGKKEAPEEIKKEKPASEAKGPPISLLVNNIKVKGLRFSFVDATKSLPDIKGTFAVNAGIKSADRSLLSSKGDMELTLDEIILQGPSIKQIKNISAALKYSADIDPEAGNIRIDEAALKIQGIPVSISGDIKNFRKGPEVDIAVSVPKTGSADLQKLIASFADIKGLALSGNFSADLKFSGIPPKTDSFKSNGEIKIDNVKYKGLTMTDFYTKYTLNNNKLEIIKMTAVAGKGKFNANSIVDLSKPGYTYSLTVSIDSLHADEVVTSFFPKAKDSVYGLLSANLKLNGAGTKPEMVKNNLVADGDFNIKDGKITNAKITDNLSQFLNIDELKTINLRKATGTIKTRNRHARLDSVFTSDDIGMNPSGDIGLDETLDLAFDLKLSPRLTKKTIGGDIGKYIKDEEGWGTVPLMVSGTFSDPSYTVDVAKAGKKVIDKEINKFLDKLFKKKQ